MLLRCNKILAQVRAARAAESVKIKIGFTFMGTSAKELVQMVLNKIQRYLSQRQRSTLMAFRTFDRTSVKIHIRHFAICANTEARQSAMQRLVENPTALIL